MAATLPKREHLSRRDWMSRVLEVAGASVLAPPLLAQEHDHNAGNASTREAAWLPAFLTGEQNETLIAIG